MDSYILRRLLFLPVVVLGVILLVFMTLQLLSPFQRALIFVDHPQQLQHIDLEVLIERYDLDKPGWTQFANWIRRGLCGELGCSTTANRSVIDCFKRFMPQLAFWAFFPIVFGGIALGVLAAVRQNRITDMALRFFAIIGWSLPAFVIGLAGLLLLYGLTGWFPPGRLGLEASQIVRLGGVKLYTGMVVIRGQTLPFALNSKLTICSSI